MSDQTPPDSKHDDKRIHHARPTYIRDSRAATVGKWLAGAAVVALVLGGGYYAMTNLPSDDAEPFETASYRSTSDAVTPYTAAPLDAASTATDVAPASASQSAAPAATSPTTAARARKTQYAEVVPEMVVGVSPASLTTDSNELVITGERRPVWAKTPTARRLSAMYPARALEREREGEASLRCIVQDGGSLDCERVSETPTRAGFGNAALRVARTFKHAPTRYDGASATGTPVNLRVMFRIADEDQRRT